MKDKLTGLSIKAAHAIAGSLGFPSKMPGTSYGLPAAACIAGAALAKIPGTICRGCYALKDFYRTPNTQQAQENRLGSITRPRWPDAMVTLLRHHHRKPTIRIDLGAVGVRLQQAGGARYRESPTGFHRWHDSGDLQSPEHFAAIAEVAKRTPNIRHWLPTQELRFVHRHARVGGTVPDNLLVRASSVFINEVTTRSWPWISTVFTGRPPAGARVCPAPKQDHQCGPCRACWDKDVPHIAYELH